MATIPQTDVSISAINTENSATTSNSLKTLSETAVEGLSTLNEAPYAMSEFRGYTHDLPFTSTATNGTYNSFTQGKNDTQRRGFFNFSDATHKLAASGNTTIYTITNVSSKSEVGGPNNPDTDSRQGLIIAGTTPSNSSPDPVGWNRVTFSNSSNNASVERTDMTFFRNNSFFSFSLGGEDMILAGSGTGTMTFS